VDNWVVSLHSRDVGQIFSGNSVASTIGLSLYACFGPAAAAHVDLCGERLRVARRSSCCSTFRMIQHKKS